jgi:thioredoxin-related protein
MKNLIFVIIVTVFIIPQNAFSQEKVKWYSFEEAFELNKTKPKKIFVDVYTDWCGWCKKMDQTTFSHPYIAEYLNKHFYPVKLNAERVDTVHLDGKMYINPNPGARRSSHQLAVSLLQGKMSYPSYVFMNEKNEWLTKVPGYQKAHAFEPILRFFGDGAYLTKSWEDYTKDFKGYIVAE